MHGREIEVFAPVVDRRPAENHLRNMFRANKVRDGIRDAAALQTNHFCAQAFGKTQICGKRAGVGLFRANFPVDVNDV